VACVPFVAGARISPCLLDLVVVGVVVIVAMEPPVLICAVAVICPAELVTTWTYPMVKDAPMLPLAIVAVLTVLTTPDTD
jgi:hypothetical protein